MNSKSHRFTLRTIVVTLALHGVWGPFGSEAREAATAKCQIDIKAEYRLSYPSEITFSLDPSLQNDFLEAATSAAKTWNDAVISAAKTWSGEQPRLLLKFDEDSPNTVGVVKDAVQQAEFNRYETLAGVRQLAITERIVIRDKKSMAWRTVINPQIKITARPNGPRSNEYDFESVMVHEFGHWAGLGHLQPGSRCNSVMTVPLPVGESRRTLFEADKAALRTLYP